MKKLMLILLVLLCMAPMVARAAAVTPESVKMIFNAWAVFIMLGWGFATKHFPPLAKLPNATIPWLNVLGFVLAQLGGIAPAQAGPLTPDGAHAAGGLLSAILGGFTNAIWARQLFEGFARPLIEGVLVKKTPARA